MDQNAESPAAAKQRVLMVTVVWGEWYLKALLELNLPSLLAQGNLPAFCAKADLVYVVMTRQADLETLRNAPAILALGRMMRVEFRVIAESETADPIGAHQRAWASATEEAKRNGRFVLFMPPDVAWSDGSFRHLARLMAEGHAAIFMTYLRVVSETFIPAARRHLDPAGATLSLDGRALVALSLEHVHPLMAAHMHDSPYFPVHPEMVLWPVKDEGVAVRCLARELFLFDPNRIDLSRQLLVGGGLDRGVLTFVDDSDDLYAVSLAPLGKDVEWHLKPGPVDPMAVARWWLVYDSPVNDAIAGHCLRWHRGGMTQAKWLRAERASGLWIRRMMALREGLRAWRGLVEARLWAAAALLALALRIPAFPRALKDGGGRSAIAFVPSDDALQRFQAEAGSLAGNARMLEAAIGRHVAFEEAAAAAALEDRLTPGQRVTLRSAAGEDLAVLRDHQGISVNGRRVLGKGERIGRHIFYAIDGVLGTPAALPQPAPAA